MVAPPLNVPSSGGAPAIASLPDRSVAYGTGHSGATAREPSRSTTAAYRQFGPLVQSDQPAAQRFRVTIVTDSTCARSEFTTELPERPAAAGAIASGESGTER